MNELSIVEAYENQETGIGVQDASLSITEAEQLKKENKRMEIKIYSHKYISVKDSHRVTDD